MKRQNLDNHEYFYAKLQTQNDSLPDIEIQDEYSESSPRGLSDEQVLKIAQDSLNDALKQSPRSITQKPKWSLRTRPEAK